MVIRGFALLDVYGRGRKIHLTAADVGACIVCILIRQFLQPLYFVTKVQVSGQPPGTCVYKIGSDSRAGFPPTHSTPHNVKELLSYSFSALR
jgi:hypothetical protein